MGTDEANEWNSTVVILSKWATRSTVCFGTMSTYSLFPLTPGR
jgi:hypothetical protein